MDIKVLQKIDPFEFRKLYFLLHEVSIPMTKKLTNRRNFPFHRRMCFGLTRARYSGIVGLSRDSILHPEIFKEITKIGDKYVPFKWTSVHMNYNVICPKHKDEYNSGDSVIISFGEYLGCNLVIEGNVFDTRHQPIMFNGNKLEHWNTDDLQGTKYSLVYYINKNCS
jgi:hypothetical protein